MLHIVLLILAIGAGATGAPDPLDGLRTLELPDQFGGVDSLDAHRGRTVVVMVVTAKRLRNLKPWERDLRDRFPGGERIDFLRITDIPEDSPASVAEVADKLKERVPDQVPVLIDLERRWATALGLDTSRPNLLLVDDGGALIAAFQGRHDPALAARVAADLSALLDPR
jgi:hypothetical protein